jgi:hypothetical protein
MSLTKVSFSMITGAPANVKDFGAVGDGTTNDRTAIQAAINSGAKQIYFPAGDYYLGTTATAINFLDFSSLGSDAAIVTNGFVRLIVETTAQVQPNIIYLKNNNHFTCGPIRFKDNGYNPLVDWQGAWGICLDNATGGNWGNVVIDAVYGESMVGVVKIVCQTIESANRIRGVKIGQLFSDNCYYGFNAQNSGDSVVIDNLVSYRNYRSFFVYGVTDHQVNIYSRNLRLTSGDVNISRNVGGLNTTNISVNYTNKDNTTPNVCNVNINHIDLLGGTISGVDLVLDIQSTQSYAPLKFVNYTGAGGSETTAPSSNYVQDIRITGSCDANASLVDVVASYAARRRLSYVQGYYFLLNATVYAAFQLNQQNTSGTPTWVGSSSNPAIGNGTLTYAIYQAEGMAFLTMKMTAGSTTTFGTGNWTFLGFGVNATYTVLGTWLAKIGGTYFSGASRILAGTAEVKGYGYNSANEFNPTFPGSWASGDELTITIAYPIS